MGEEITDAENNLRKEIEAQKKMKYKKNAVYNTENEVLYFPQKTYWYKVMRKAARVNFFLILRVDMRAISSKNTG